MTDFDSPWKETLDTFFDPFLLLVFPEIHAEIDWSRGYEFLDKELQKIDPNAELGRGVVDKLVKVWLRTGEEYWLLLHIEIQTYQEADFSERMFVYNMRLFLLYNREVISVAVLGDDRPNWRPGVYSSQRWGCRKEFEFPIVKLLDWLPHAEELLVSTNPVAHVVLAHLRALETKGQPEDRRVQKFQLVRNLYDLGFSVETARRILRLIDWLMTLPRELENEFCQDVNRLEEEKHVPYVTSFERFAKEEGHKKGLQEGLKEGLQEGLKEGLQEGMKEGLKEGMKEGLKEGLKDGLQRGIATVLKIKFGDMGKALIPDIRNLDVETLNKILQALDEDDSLESVRRLVQRAE